MAVAADWSELPKDILKLISQQIDNEIDLIHFRSICSIWRYSSIPIHHHISLPFKFPLQKNFHIPIENELSDPFCSLSKRNFFLIKPPQQDQTLIRRPWLIRVTQNSSGKTKLHDFSFLPFKLNSFFPFSIDLYKSSVRNLGTYFTIDEKSLHNGGYIYPKKVVSVTPFIFAILLDNGQLALLRSGDGCFIMFPGISSSIGFGDICFFKGRIYAVEAHGGKTISVGLKNFSVELVTKDVHGLAKDMRFMVESEGELLLVYVYLSLFFEIVAIYVFRLDEKEKEWVKLTSLGDRVLFLGNGCSFSVSASDLSVAKGNCVIFMEDVFPNNQICDGKMRVFHLDQNRLSPLRNYPDYLNLFWPPPKSIVKG